MRLFLRPLIGKWSYHDLNNMEGTPEKRILSGEEHVEGPQNVPEEMIQLILKKKEAKTREEAERIAVQRMRQGIKEETEEEIQWSQEK